MMKKLQQIYHPAHVTLIKGEVLILNSALIELLKGVGYFLYDTKQNENEDEWNVIYL